MRLCAVSDFLFCWAREKERHPAGRFCYGRRAGRSPVSTCRHTPCGTPAFPANHDDHHGSDARRSAPNARPGSPHNSDGLLLQERDETAQVTAFISRRVTDDWSIRDSLTGGEKVSFASNITHSVHTICRQSRVSSPPNMIGVQPSIVSIRSWTFYSRTSRTVAKGSM
jgi:hypothetical protein